MKNNETKHTPGPWKVDQDADGSFTIEPETAHRSASYVAVLDRRGCRDQETREANARLIASAPALLEALQGMVNIATHPQTSLAAIRQIAGDARAAIAAAKETEPAQ